ncbi:hypothetical protein S820908_155 [Synechococcus phage S-CAM9]|uniref:Uncharacterized protein n=1 Tax=Synechococcus phage S-CAM9 TaxID=1883369 RepID=A0A1D8KQ53_9CAUD|nr:hypothetical protein BOW85_gp093 [Synechococcus phage S-CAM9]AOV60302.1 hypothetical protein S050808_155 [Synechococcus phage S-CAM9]AOV60530.1 hypothetical protein S820908_155 [Synechococcus phage S-CAM9]AOV60759.1 hypothetical protein N161109_156 [Synechococcus phage S-CAM9]
MKTFRQFVNDITEIQEDSRRTSNKQHTQRVKANIKTFGSNYTPPNNWVPDAGPSGEGEVLTRKQIEKGRRKALRNSGTSGRTGRGGRGGGGFSSPDTATYSGISSFDPSRHGGV